MKLVALTAALAASLFGATTTTAGDFEPKAEKVTICHRTGNKAEGGLFRGHLITISAKAVAQHTGQHGDLVVPENLLSRFPGGACAVGADGRLYDGEGRPVTGGDPEGPG